MLDRTDQFAALRAANAARDQIWDSEGKINALFRSNEFSEEAAEVIECILDQFLSAAQFLSKVGKVAGIVKKLEREAMGMKGSRKTIGDLKHEIGDTMITLDLLCMEYDIDIWEATKEAFNKKSDEHGFDIHL